MFVKLFNEEKEFNIEGSKSILNRVLLISSFLEDELFIINQSSSEDIKTMTEALRAFCKFEVSGENLKVVPCIRSHEKSIIEINDSATALRFLVTRLAIAEDRLFSINVSEQLSRRPISELISTLKYLKADIDFSAYPMNIKGKKIRGSKVNISGNLSSQFVSSLLLSAPYFRGGLEIIINDEQVSKKYITMTINVMADFGILVDEGDGCYIIPSGRYVNPGSYEIEPDFSSASYIWALGALADKYIGVNYCKNISIQGDYHILDILQNMGAHLNRTEGCIKVKSNKLLGITLNMRDMPDLLPTVVFLALFAEGKTCLSGLSHLKYKESDRIKVLISELDKLGARLIYVDDELTVEPLIREPVKVTLSTHNDHRMAMIFIMLSVIYPQIKVDNYDCIGKSFPGFLDVIHEIKSSISDIVKY